MSLIDKLNAYILPGRVADARVGLEQARIGEKLGLDGIFVSERWDTKEIGSVIGALTQATERVKLVAGLTHFGTRHPLVLAGMASTLQTLSSGRFVLGFGRSVPSLFRKLGINVLNNAAMADFTDILRKLWRGETVSYSGPVGDFPEMELGQPCADPPPIILGAIGPKTLALAGTHFDGVVLHPFLTVEGVERSVAITANAARAAGRDPSLIKIYATVVTAPDNLSPEQRQDVVEARAVSYFMHREVGRLIIEMNGWDPAPMHRILEQGLSRLESQADIGAARRQMAEAATLLPPEWLDTGAAVGSTAKCVARLDDYVAAGADSILLHGMTCDQQEPLINAIHASAI